MTGVSVSGDCSRVSYDDRPACSSRARARKVSRWPASSRCGRSVVRAGRVERAGRRRARRRLPVVERHASRGKLVARRRPQPRVQRPQAPHARVREVDAAAATQIALQGPRSRRADHLVAAGSLGNGDSRDPVIGNSGYYVTFESRRVATSASTRSGGRATATASPTSYLFTDVRDITLVQSVEREGRAGAGRRREPVDELLRELRRCSTRRRRSARARGNASDLHALPRACVAYAHEPSRDRGSPSRLIAFLAAADVASAGRRQTTELISRAADGGTPNGPSTNAVISGDRRYARVIAFESDASDLVRGDTNGVRRTCSRSRARGIGQQQRHGVAAAATRSSCRAAWAASPAERPVVRRVGKRRLPPRRAAASRSCRARVEPGGRRHQRHASTPSSSARRAVRRGGCPRRAP